MQSPICRKRRTSSIMEGQFTRSKSQIYLHCNRSGRVRADPTRFKRSEHQLRQLDSPVKKSKRVVVENAEEVSVRVDSTRFKCSDRIDPPKRVFARNPEAASGPVDSIRFKSSQQLDPSVENAEEVSGQVRVDSTRLKISDHQLQQIDSPLKKSKRVVVENPGEVTGRVCVDLTRFKLSDPPVKQPKSVTVENSDEVSLGLCEMSRTPIKDLRARRVFSPEVSSIVLENADNSKKGEPMVFTEKKGIELELNGKKVDDFGVKKCVEIGNVNGVGKLEIESTGNVIIPKSCSAVNSSLRRKVFVAPSSYSYRRLLPYLMDAAREYSGASEIETRDTSSKSNDTTLSYLKPHLRSTTSNGFASVDKHVGTNSDVTKTLGSVVEGQKIEVNVSCNPQDLNDVPDVLSQTQVEPQVFANGDGLDPEVLEVSVQATPPDADILLKANMSDLGVSVEHNAQQMEKKFVGHSSDSRNGCTVKRSSLTPGTNGNAPRNKLALNPCSKLKKVFKAASSVSYRRLLPYLMDVAKNDPAGASSENGLPKFWRDLECNRPSMSVSKEVPTNKDSSPKKDEIKEQDIKLLELNCTSVNDVSDYINSCISTEISSSASDSFCKMPSSVFPDDVADSQALLNVEITRKSETESTDTSNTEKLEPECLDNEINTFNTGANFSGVLPSSNISPESSAGENKVAIPNLLPMSLEDLLSEYGIEDPKVEPISPEGDRMTWKADCNEVNRNSVDNMTGTVRIHANASEAPKKELFLKMSVTELISNESSCKVFLAGSNGDSAGLDTVSLIKSSSSTEPSDLTGYGSDPTKALCESIQEISQAEPIGSPSDCMSVVDNLNKNECLAPAICYQKSTQNETSYDLITHPDVLNRGILKRNPRGCRGLCNCLNCASFRLHAERSFEFSRNQMQDTEEVSLGLMKELADMRIFLEKHLCRENNLAPIPLTQLEVEEACTKALEAEQRAKERLSQMNNELNYHCRVPSLYRPRVTFATHIEEKAVAKIESSSSKPVDEAIKAGTKRTRKKHH
ncbi:uncharacterized protein LOC107864352 isoform X1 [Capsicum annuum]|uniref:uncharacterized protein LOC107864352 isoform X1 n=1 Tax=Capsicum annuum TaxID=4072 RepID=UPI0007BF2932|nr:uncharacterized protein LOC107864352 isoform X1 [Capsicum annuum]